MNTLSLPQVDPQDRHRQPPGYDAQRLGDQGLLAGQQRNCFNPAGGDIGHRQGLDERSGHIAAAVGHQVDLKVAGIGAMPIGKGPDGDCLMVAIAAAGISSAAAGGLADWFEHPIDRRRTDCQELVACVWVQPQVSVAL